MANDIISHVERDSFKKEEKPFKPHLTLARIKKIKDIDTFNAFLRFKVKQEFEVKGFSLMESNLTPLGPEYSTIETFNFPL